MNPVATATLLGAVAIFAGCTNAGSPIFILQNQVPGEGCSVTNSGTEFNPRGSIDTNATAGYLFTPVVENVGDVETRVQGLVFVEGADIDITMQSGFITEEEVAGDETYAALTKFSKRFSGTIEPNGGMTSFAFTVLPLQLMTDYMAARLATDGSQVVEVRVDVSIFGNMGGGDVRTPTYSYWIDVCNGCMKQDLGACTSLASGYTALAGGPCVELQDVPLECCTAADSSEVCPAVPATAE